MVKKKNLVWLIPIFIVNTHTYNSIIENAYLTTSVNKHFYRSLSYRNDLEAVG